MSRQPLTTTRCKRFIYASPFFTFAFPQRRHRNVPRQKKLFDVFAVRRGCPFGAGRRFDIFRGHHHHTTTHNCQQSRNRDSVHPGTHFAPIFLPLENQTKRWRRARRKYSDTTVVKADTHYTIARQRLKGEDPSRRRLLKRRTDGEAARAPHLKSFSGELANAHGGDI